MWLFHNQGEGAFDREDVLGLLSALARNWLGQPHCHIDGHSVGKCASVEFIMLSGQKTVLPRHVYTRKQANHASALAMA